MSNERKFLHDISTPLTASYTMLEDALDRLKSSSSADHVEETERLERALKALKSAISLIAARREEICKK